MTRPRSLPALPEPLPARHRGLGAETSLPPLQGSATRLATVADRAAAVAAWAALARHAETRFFHSEAWLRCWLERLPAEATPWLLQARRDQQVVGLAFVVKGPARRLFGLPFAPAWHLQATGTPLDAICVEHNDMLVDRAHAAAARRMLIDQWRRLGQGARELHLTNLGTPPNGSDWALHLQPGGHRLRVRTEVKPSFSVDLQKVRNRGHDLLGLCSANLRSQVRRSMRAYAALGELKLDAAPDTATARHWFSRLAALHQQHWTSRGQPGAFANPAFVSFHHRLIDTCGTDAATPTHVQLLRLTAGEHEVAYLYNLVHAGRVHFYQSGLDYAIGDKQARPGYAAHVLAVELNAGLGHAEYDFLMGDTRYKRDLATDRQSMHTVVLQTPGLRFTAEALLRRLRDRQRARRVPPSSEPDQ